MIRALHLGSTLFAAAFVSLTVLGVISLGGTAWADPPVTNPTSPSATCGNYNDPDPCSIVCPGGVDCQLMQGCPCK